MRRISTLFAGLTLAAAALVGSASQAAAADIAPCSRVATGDESSAAWTCHGGDVWFAARATCKSYSTGDEWPAYGQLRKATGQTSYVYCRYAKVIESGPAAL
ncbi:hypothetical protein Aph01nite_15370 [Acrocarpospora phusangensis]|uniref:Uncharacterized protein n=1 Tax=Acrocarpospora phusangensis TaxID=1070424 RepID=A0A919Q6J3_9ACTN|nr:hypothetical protein Aph01nite_15370 [Acrocarpospora phusangensis]